MVVPENYTAYAQLVSKMVYCTYSTDNRVLSNKESRGRLTLVATGKTIQYTPFSFKRSFIVRYLNGS